jgi:hypothetical protein
MHGPVQEGLAAAVFVTAICALLASLTRAITGLRPPPSWRLHSGQADCRLPALGGLQSFQHLFEAFASQGVKAVSKELATVHDASLKLFAFVTHKPATWI